MEYSIGINLGASSLAAWNSWITAEALLGRLLRDTPYESSFEAWISALFMAANLMSLTLLTLVPVVPHRRMRFGLILQLAVFSAVLLTLRLPLGPDLLVVFLMMLVILSGVGAALMASSYAVVQECGRDHLSIPITTGCGLIAVVVSLLALFLGDAGSSLFGLGIVQTLVSLWGLERVLLQPATSLAEHSPLLAPQTIISDNQSTPSLLLQEAGESAGERSKTLSLEDRKRVLWVAKEYLAAIFIDFAVTLAVFPALCASVKSVNTPSDSYFTNSLIQYFTPLMFVLFNVGDSVGKFLPTYPQTRLPTARITLIASLARIIFIPLLMSCNVTSPHVLPRLFDDIGFYGIVFLLGVTNGWIGSDLFLQAPTQVWEEILASQGGEGAVEVIAGDLMMTAVIQGVCADFCVYGMTAGLAVGGWASLLFV